MFLSNYWKFLAVILGAQASVLLRYYSNYCTWNGLNRTFKDINGNVHNYYACWAQVNNPTSTTGGENNVQYVSKYLKDNFGLNNNLIAKIGTGDTAPTKDDYCLETDVTSSFNVTINNLTIDGDEGLTTTVTITGTNNSNNSITIKEIGLAKTIYYSANNSTQEIQQYPQSCVVLLFRTVLEEFVTVAPTEAFSLSFQIIMR